MTGHTHTHTQGESGELICICCVEWLSIMTRYFLPGMITFTFCAITFECLDCMFSHQVVHSNIAQYVIHSIPDFPRMALLQLAHQIIDT